MNFSNVRLILLREIRDQLRDRRTLFMIAVLPVLLYPLLGMSLFQVAQFMQEHPTRVLVVGAKENFADLPPLFESEQFAPRLFVDCTRAGLLELFFAADQPLADEDSTLDARAKAFRQVQSGKFEAALYFPPDFAQQLDAFREAVRSRAKNIETKQAAADGTSGTPSKKAKGPEGLEIPRPEILYNSANDKSQLAHARLLGVLERWTEQIGNDNLATSGVPKDLMRPFLVESADVANIEQREASMWSKVLPVLLILWAMTGAFYPAVDLCAGEKERGTLETLLCSPAGRDEIVVGKLFTIMIFSIATAVLNLVSLGATGWVVVTQLPGFGPPPLAAVVVMVVALLPISALFSALCLALAAFARSTKEGQYYLMPLMLITMPLVILPMSPGVELNLGNSMIPITGIVLMLRSVLEGNYWLAVQYSPTVTLITLTACLLSIRWAIDQFNTESVLFRESERLDLRLWLRHLYRDRQATPTAAAAMFGGVLILVVKFFMSLSPSKMDTFGQLTQMALVTQVLVIAAPAVLLTFFLARSPRETLLLKWPSWATIPAAILLAVAVHPMANVLQTVVAELYPISENVRPALEQMQGLLQHANFFELLLVIAVVPAICEELAFRGFVLSGFRRLGHKWRAIIYTSVFFGLAHGILQQSLIACLLGVVLGFLAAQCGSILPGMVFHCVHNGLALANSRVTLAMIPDWPWIRKLILPVEGGGCNFEWPLVLIGLLTTVLLLRWFGRLPGSKSSEEILTEAIERGEHQPASAPVDAPVENAAPMRPITCN